MNKASILKSLALVGKITGVVAGLGAIPFIPQQYGVLVFAGASILKDLVNRAGDLLDDGLENKSFRAD